MNLRSRRQRRGPPGRQLPATLGQSSAGLPPREEIQPQKEERESPQHLEATRPLRDRIGFVNPDTIATIVAVAGTNLALFALLSRRIDSMEGRLNGRIDALSSRIDALHSRIDALYQALFSRKDPAA